MAQSATIKAILTLSTKQFTTALERAQSKLSRFGQRLTRTGRDLSFALTVPLATAGRTILKVATDFDLIQRKIGALGGTGKIAALEKSARELGATTIFTATQVGELQLNLRKLGRTNDEIEKIQGTVLKFAQAMDTDLGESGLFVVQTMNRFADELENVGDAATQAEFVTNLFAKAAAESAIDADKLRSSLNFTGSELAQFEISLQNGTALLAVLANRGFEASRGGTALRRILGELAQEGFTGNEAIQELLSSTRDFAGQLEQFGLRGAGSASALAGLRDEYDLLNAKLEQSSGFLDQFQELIDDSLFAKFRRLRSAVEELALVFGEALEPAISDILDSVTEFVLSMRDLDRETIKTISAIGGFLAVLGPLSLIMGGLVISASGFVGAIGNLGRITGLGGVVTSLGRFAKLGPALAAIFGVISVGKFAFDKIFEGVGAANRNLEEYNKLVKEAQEETQRLQNLKGIPVELSTTDLQKNLQTLRENFDIEQQKLIDAIQAQEFGAIGLERFIAETQANVDIIAEQITTFEEKIRKAAEAGQKDLGLEDIRTSSLEQLIAKFRELQELRAKITGDGAANFIVDLDQLAKVDKAISNVEKSIKALTVEGGIEPLLPDGFFSDVPTQEQLELLQQVNRARLELFDQGFDVGPVTFAEFFGPEQFVEPIEQLITPEFQASLEQGISQVELMRRSVLDLSQAAIGFGDIFGSALNQAIQGTENFADALKNNLLNALAVVAAKVAALIVAYIVLAIVSGGTTLGAGAGQFANMNFGQFMSSGLGMGIAGFGGGTRSTQVGTLSGNDLAISTRRGVTANDRIYG